MKKIKIFLTLAIAFTIVSCNEAGDASVESNLVVEQVQVNNEDGNCPSCLVNSYKYRVKLETNSGSIYYYTDYKHEAGDTLLSIFEFTDKRERIIKNMEVNADSLIEINSELEKKNNELELYNELLMGIIQENAKGSAVE